MQSIGAIHHLMKKETTSQTRYSNANMKNLCQGIEGWHAREPTASLSEGRTDATVRINNLWGDEIDLELVLVKDFQTACSNLASYLSSSSYPIQRIFPEFFASPGEIKLQTPPDTLYHTLLWVYHNVFVRVELSMYGPGRTSTNSLEIGRSFKVLAEELFRRIRDGSKQSQSQTTIPTVTDIQSPSSIKVGDMFDVDVTVDVTCLYHVECHNSVSNSLYARTISR